MLVKILKEALTRSSYTEYTKLVAHAYEARPLKDKDISSWDVLNRHNHLMFKRLSANVKVKFVSGIQPYETADEMREDVKKNGRLLINTDYSKDLVNGWSEEDNWMLRTVHDYVVHIGGGHDFSMKGEIAAFNTHAKIAPPKALPALFSEVVGQASYYIVFGKFIDVQKASVLHGFDYKKLGEVDKEQYLLNWSLDLDQPKEVPKEVLKILESYV